MKKVKEAGFHIAARKETELTKDIAEQFYADHAEKEYYGDLVEHMTRYEINISDHSNLYNLCDLVS